MKEGYPHKPRRGVGEPLITPPTARRGAAVRRNNPIWQRLALALPVTHRQTWSQASGSSDGSTTVSSGAPLRGDLRQRFESSLGAEHEADRAAAAMFAGARVSIGSSPLRVARKTTGEIVEWWSDLDDVEWDPKYRDKYNLTRPKGETPQSDFDKQKESGTLKAASAGGKGTKVGTRISPGQLHRIILAGGEKAAADHIAPMAEGISEAFKTMLIDTAQAQAVYLAHMAGETGGVLEEVSGDKRDYAPFQGRGAVQVTHAENYAKALGILQQRADQIEKQLEQSAALIAALMTQRDDATSDGARKKATAEIESARSANEGPRLQLLQLQEAINAIKEDPATAADKKFAHLFSAAHMHRTKGVTASAGLGATASFTGKGPEDTWVTGGNKKMTFSERKTQNENEIRELENQRATVTDPDESKKIDKGIAARKLLIDNMVSATSRGRIKAKVYKEAVKVLSNENIVTTP